MGLLPLLHWPRKIVKVCTEYLPYSQGTHYLVHTVCRNGRFHLTGFTWFVAVLLVLHWTWWYNKQKRWLDFFCLFLVRFKKRKLNKDVIDCLKRKKDLGIYHFVGYCAQRHHWLCVDFLFFIFVIVGKTLVKSSSLSLSQYRSDPILGGEILFWH